MTTTRRWRPLSLVACLVFLPWVAAATSESRVLQESSTTDGTSSSTRGQVELVNLLGFTVQIALSTQPDDTSNQPRLFDVSDQVRAWMTSSFAAQLLALGYVATSDDESANATEAILYDQFNAIVLVEDDDGGRRQRKLQSTDDASSGNDPTNDGEDITTLGGSLFTATYTVGALFRKGEPDAITGQPTTIPVPVDICESIQQTTLLNDAVLLRALQRSSDVGLGSNVLDVRAFLTRDADSIPNSDGSTGGSSSGGNNGDNGGTVANGGNSAAAGEEDGTITSSNLEIVIIVAICVAGVAFLFLLFALFWAWRYEKRNRDAYLVTNTANNQANANGCVKPSTKAPGSPTATEKSPGSPETRNRIDPELPLHHRHGDMMQSPIKEIDVRHRHHSHDENHVSSGDTFTFGDTLTKGSNYPESVVSSEDIESSLSQYYQSGPYYGGVSRHHHNHPLNDAASISSMDSYGYSLDGYTPSLVARQEDPHQQGNSTAAPASSPPKAKLLLSSLSSPPNKTTLGSSKVDVGTNLPTEPAGYDDEDEDDDPDGNLMGHAAETPGIDDMDDNDDDEAYSAGIDYGPDSVVMDMKDDETPLTQDETNSHIVLPPHRHHPDTTDAVSTTSSGPDPSRAGTV